MAVENLLTKAHRILWPLVVLIIMSLFFKPMEAIIYATAARIATHEIVVLPPLDVVHAFSGADPTFIRYIMDNDLANSTITSSFVQREPQLSINKRLVSTGMCSFLGEVDIAAVNSEAREKNMESSEVLWGLRCESFYGLVRSYLFSAAVDAGLKVGAAASNVRR